MKKDIVFIFNKNYKKVFEELKTKLTSILIFGHYDPERKTILELNTSDSVTVGIFS